MFDEVYDKLVDANPNMMVYKKENIPEHFHYRHNARIMPIIIEAKEGWTIMQNKSGPFMCKFKPVLTSRFLNKYSLYKKLKNHYQRKSFCYQRY